MPEVGIIGRYKPAVEDREYINLQRTPSDSIQKKKKKDTTREELDDLNKPVVSEQGQNDTTVNVEENQDFDTDTVDETDQETNKTLGTGKIREEETQTTPLTNGKINKISKSMPLDNKEFELPNAKPKEFGRRTSASNLFTPYYGSCSSKFGGNVIHKQHEANSKLAFLDVGKSVIGTSDVNGIIKALKGIGELKPDGTFITDLQKIYSLLKNRLSENASEQVNRQNGEVTREDEPYVDDLFALPSENDNNTENNFEKQLIVLLSYEKNKNDDGDENDTETKKSRKLTFRLNVITPEHFREAMRDAQMNTYELTYSRLFPNNCRLFIELPINRNGFIGGAEKKAVKRIKK